jgi:hypothetical protein
VGEVAGWGFLGGLPAFLNVRKFQAVNTSTSARAGRFRPEIAMINRGGQPLQFVRSAIFWNDDQIKWLVYRESRSSSSQFNWGFLGIPRLFIACGWSSCGPSHTSRKCIQNILHEETASR